MQGVADQRRLVVPHIDRRRDGQAQGKEKGAADGQPIDLRIQ